MRTYKRKTSQADLNKELIKRAAREAIQGKKSIRQAAKDNNLSQTTLTRYVKKMKRKPESEVFKEYTNPRQVFTPEQEQILKDYFGKVSSQFYGLTAMAARSIAYGYAVQFKITVPNGWHSNKMAGKDWFFRFRQRHTEVTLKKDYPEPGKTSINKDNVKLFYNKLAAVMRKFEFPPSRIWNINEFRVVKSCKSIAVKGKPRVSAVTPTEPGTVTVIGAMSAAGDTVPVMFIFPRKKFHNFFIENGPPECIGRGNGSGLITQDDFHDFLEHFIDHLKPKKKSPILLLLDNHPSHLAMKTFELAEKNWVVMISFPPECGHKLRPFDVTVYELLKKHISSEHDAWLSSNPGKSFSIFNIPELVATALPESLTPMNIINGFERAGVYPFNSDMLSEDEFMTDDMEPEFQSQIDIDESIKTEAESELLKPINFVDVDTPVAEAVSHIQSRIIETEGESDLLKPIKFTEVDIREVEPVTRVTRKRRAITKNIQKLKKTPARKADNKVCPKSDTEIVKEILAKRKGVIKTTNSSDSEEDDDYYLVCVGESLN